LAASIHLDESDAAQRKRLGNRKPRESAFSKEELRGWALKTLASRRTYSGLSASAS
jgi:hypothetical protein